MFYADVLWISVRLNLQAQGRRPAQPAKPTQVDYSRFKHSSHTGETRASRIGTNRKLELDCAYCHGALTTDAADILKSYPYRKNGLKNQVAHSACSDCHAITGRDSIVTGSYPAMCLICHQNTNPAQMGRNLRVFPNQAVAESQFFDFYSHQEHVGYFKNSATFKERFKDKEKFKEEDHFECIACHTMNQANIVVAKIRFAPGVKQGLPGHTECFVCHFNEMGKEKPFFAANCEACHTTEREPTGKGSELAVHYFVRQIVNSEKNPPIRATSPGEEPTGPFSHTNHLIEDDADKSSKKCLDCQTQKCLECHVTAKKAEKRSDFFLEYGETKQKQPPAANCIQCHKENMEQKIGGVVKIESSKCLYCHSVQTIKARAASDAQLPPPNHFGK